VLREDQSVVTLNLYYVNNGNARVGFWTQDSAPQVCVMGFCMPCSHTRWCSMWTVKPYDCIMSVLVGAGVTPTLPKRVKAGPLEVLHVLSNLSIFVCRYLRRSASSLPILQLPICS
ncbi:hypothetical protein Tco_1169959, partial [Tanacetum coccineum]